MALLAVVALGPSGDAAGQSAAPRDVTGRWSGYCDNCPVRGFTLVLTQSGEQLSGTLQAVGRTGLGEREMPLQDGKIAGRSISFRATGADGIPLACDLRLSEDSRSMRGRGRHRAEFGLTFTRSGQ